MIKYSFLIHFAMVVLILFISSCNSSRLYKDYTYTPREQAPDISGSELSENKAQTSNPKVSIAPPLTQNEIKTGQDKISTENEQKIKIVVQAFKEEMVTEEETISKTSNRQLMKKVSSRLVEEGQISNLSAREEKKLDRMAVKMDKKLKKQGKEIDFRNNTPLELFFMIMAIGGLVLGIVGVSFGWFIFIVFAGLWLYFKLVVDNK